MPMTVRFVSCSAIVLILSGACGRGGLGVARDAADGRPRGEDGSAGAGGAGGANGDLAVATEIPVAGQCPDGFSACGKAEGPLCHDLSRSTDHCGACGHACAPGIACRDGACQQYACKGALTFKSLATSQGDVRAIGDFDGDGIVDLLGTDSVGVGMVAGGGMIARFGAGDGTYPVQAIVGASDSGAWQARAADLDRDGRLDLVSVDGYFVPGTGTAGEGAMTVRRASGNRQSPFGEPTRYPTDGHLATLLLADFDRDGRLDVVASASAGLEYWRGQDGLRFEHQALLSSPEMDTWQPGIPTAMDWNDDGIVDLVYSIFGFGETGYATVGSGGPLMFRLGHGDGTFEPEVVCAIVAGVSGDFDHDHRPDLINGTGFNGSNLLLGIDTCHASSVTFLPNSPKQGGATLADVNGDGTLDFIADNDKNILVWTGDGKGGFAQYLSLSAYQAGQWPIGVVLTGDLNRDGKVDIVYARDGRWGVFLNTCP